MSPHPHPPTAQGAIIDHASPARLVAKPTQLECAIDSIQGYPNVLLLLLLLLLTTAVKFLLMRLLQLLLSTIQRLLLIAVLETLLRLSTT